MQKIVIYYRGRHRKGIKIRNAPEVYLQQKTFVLMN